MEFEIDCDIFRAFLDALNEKKAGDPKFGILKKSIFTVTSFVDDSLRYLWTSSMENP
jgi:hypothetical protein